MEHSGKDLWKILVRKCEGIVMAVSDALLKFVLPLGFFGCPMVVLRVCSGVGDQLLVGHVNRDGHQGRNHIWQRDESRSYR